MFDDPIPIEKGMLRSPNDRRWYTQVDAIMSQFRRAFPEIKYDVAWNVCLLNGSAWRKISERHVTLYGGLLRHRLIGIEAATLLFAHETGHHYGGPPRDTIYEWMSCECQADYWAARYGVRAVLGGAETEVKRVVLAGARQILKFERHLMKLGVHRLERSGDCLDHASPEIRYKIFLKAASLRLN